MTHDQVVYLGILGLGALAPILIGVIVSQGAKISRLKSEVKAKEEERRGVAIALGEMLRHISLRWDEYRNGLVSERDQIWVRPGELYFIRHKANGGSAGHGLPLDEATGQYLIGRLPQDDGAFQPPTEE